MNNSESSMEANNEYRWLDDKQDICFKCRFCAISKTLTQPRYNLYTCLSKTSENSGKRIYAPQRKCEHFKPYTCEDCTMFEKCIPLGSLPDDNPCKEFQKNIEKYLAISK